MKRESCLLVPIQICEGTMLNNTHHAGSTGIKSVRNFSASPRILDSITKAFKNVVLNNNVEVSCCLDHEAKATALKQRSTI